MAVIAPFSAEAGRTEISFAVRTRGQTVVANTLAATIALAGAAAAKLVITIAAANAAALAEGVPAGFAQHLTVLTNEAAAVATVDGPPILERDVRAPLVVGGQDAGNDREKIEQPALLQSQLNRCPPGSFAERFFLHVRMRHMPIGSSRIGIEGDNAIVPRFFRIVFEGQTDLETPQLGTLQDNLCCDNDDFSIFKIHFDGCEFFCQRPQITEDLRDRCMPL